MQFCERDPKGLFWKFEFDCGVYAYIRSMGKDCLRVMNVGNFFYIYSGASMDRNYGGSDPRTSRYRAAIGSISSKSFLSASSFLQKCESALSCALFYPNLKPNYLIHLPHFALPFAACHGVIDLLQLLNTITANNTNTINFFIIFNFI